MIEVKLKRSILDTSFKLCIDSKSSYEQICRAIHEHFKNHDDCTICGSLRILDDSPQTIYYRRFHEVESTVIGLYRNESAVRSQQLFLMTFHHN